MTQRRISSTEEALEEAFDQIRKLKSRLNQPQTQVRIEDWVIRENDAGDLIIRNEVTGTTYPFPK